MSACPGLPDGVFTFREVAAKSFAPSLFRREMSAEARFDLIEAGLEECADRCDDSNAEDIAFKLRSFRLALNLARAQVAETEVRLRLRSWRERKLGRRSRVVRLLGWLMQPLRGAR